MENKQGEIKRRGIVIKTVKYQETAKIIHVLTTDGIESLLVRGANSYKSKNYRYAQELTSIEFEVARSKKGGFNTLTTGEITNNYTQIKTDYARLKIGYLFLEVVSQFASFIDDMETFYNFSLTILVRINEDKNFQYYLMIYRLKLLYLLGIAPDFNHCDCGGGNFLGFSIKKGKMICNRCYSDEIVLSKDVSDAMKFFYRTKINLINDQVIENLPNLLDELNNAIDNYYQTHLDFTSRTMKVINKII